MSFFGYSFVFDNIPSETFGLVISKMNSSMTGGSTGGSDIEIIKQKVKRKANYFIQGVEQSTPLEFELEFYSENEIDRHNVALIQKWLFGQTSYKKLRIMQNDLYNVYFNCILKEPEIQTVGNLVYGFKCTVECDAPWAWEKDALYTLTNISTSRSFKYYNSSDDKGYTYPTIYFKASAAGSVSIKNITDNNNDMIFTNLLINDDLTINTDLQIITTVQTVTPLSKFNFKWFKLVPGYNDILITGNLSTFSITHKVARKVGS